MVNNLHSPIEAQMLHCYNPVLATVPSSEAIALTKPCRCSCKLNGAVNLTGIVANLCTYTIQQLN